jgi:hypothetical protein
MKRTSVIAISAALVASLAIGAAYVFRGSPTAEPDAARTTAAHSEAASQIDTVLPAEQRASLTPERSRQVALEIERALVSSDPHQRETALNFLLPELIDADPARVVAIMERQQPGEVRDALRDEVTRQWTRRDRDAAVDWMRSLDEADRKASATIAMRTLAASSPALAIEVADQFGVGRDDGSLEHMVQIWATEKPDEATRWLESQPANDPRTAQLRARIEQVRAQQR